MLQKYTNSYADSCQGFISSAENLVGNSSVSHENHLHLSQWFISHILAPLRFKLIIRDLAGDTGKKPASAEDLFTDVGKLLFETFKQLTYISPKYVFDFT